MADNALCVCSSCASGISLCGIWMDGGVEASNSPVVALLEEARVGRVGDVERHGG